MEKTKYTCSKKILVHVMIVFWITQFFFQNLTQERDCINCQNVPKEKKSTIKNFGLEIAYHTP
jgi:hypothetical protein